MSSKSSSIAFAILISFLLSCGSHNKEEKSYGDVEIADTVVESSTIPTGDSNHITKNKSLLWQVDDAQGFKLQKPGIPGIDKISAENLIQLINNNSDSIHLDYIKTSHDTIYVYIPHSEMLTSRIGSTGADIYMASATYSLTELKGINYINYDFEEGDHASPGVYTRNDFKNFH